MASNRYTLLFLTPLLVFPADVRGQQTLHAGETHAEQRQLTRQELLESDRWHQLVQSFDAWLSVQKVYNQPEVAALQDGLKERVAAMSADELLDFIYDTEERLAVLMSDEAVDARHFLSFFTEQARRERVAPNGNVPDVFGMTVSELRQELESFQRRRAERSAAQQAFNRGQTEQARAVMQDQRVRAAQREKYAREAHARQARLQTQQLRQRQQQQQPRSRYIPRRRPLVTSEMAAQWAILQGLRGF